MKIYFARHGESQANLLQVISNRQLNHELTQQGKEQARKLAERFEGERIAKVYSSPLLRAVQTASILAGALGVKYELADGLREYDCGVAEGRSDEGAWRLWQAEYDAWLFGHDYTYKIEGGESYQDVCRRFVPFVEGLVKVYGKTSGGVMCISHGGIYSVMLPQVVKNVTAEMVLKYGFDYTSCIVAEQKLGNLVCLEWNGTPIPYANQ